MNKPTGMPYTPIIRLIVSFTIDLVSRSLEIIRPAILAKHQVKSFSLVVASAIGSLEHASAEFSFKGVCDWSAGWL